MTEVFGGSVDWFSSTGPAAAATDTSSTWTSVETSLPAVSNGHIDVWPTLTSSGNY